MNRITPSNKSKFRPLLLLFVMANALAIVFRHRLEKINIQADVVIVANLLLFLISLLVVSMQLRPVDPKKPHAMVRGAMVGMALKLFGLGAAVIIYLYMAGPSRSVNALFVSMGLYILYTWLEVRIALRQHPKKNAVN